MITCSKEKRKNFFYSLVHAIEIYYFKHLLFLKCDMLLAQNRNRPVYISCSLYIHVWMHVPLQTSDVALNVVGR